MNDYWYRDMSGFGGGIEDVRLGNSMFALALLGGSVDELRSDGRVVPENEFVFNKFTADVRVYDLPVLHGRLALIGTLSGFDGDSLETIDETIEVKDSGGWALGFMQKYRFKSGGYNQFVGFYGTGAAENLKAVMTQPTGLDIGNGEDVVNVDKFRRLLLLNDLVIELSSRVSLQWTAVYRRLNNGQNTKEEVTWYSTGLRPTYHFGRNFNIELEAGWDYTEQKDADSGHLFKITVAPQISPAMEALSRPALRAFFTYAKWSDAFVGQVAPQSFGMDSQGISAGIQLETWW